MDPDAESFERPAAAYDRFVGRYGPALARELVDFAHPAGRALDVGCGPGALTAELAARLGPGDVAAIDRSETFAGACRERLPGVDVHVASAEDLPFADDHFDAVLSQLVVNFLPDAAAGLAEMRRVARPGAVIAACVWDYAGEMTMLRAFWDAVHDTDPAAAAKLDEGARMPYSRPEPLARLWRSAGLGDVATQALVVHARYDGFADFWEPFTAGIGPAGAYCASLDAPARARLRDACHARLGEPDGPFELSARAWAVRGTAP
ncbi:MAG: hypothetical protein QOE65_1689 [Solirubrobacteraceae bacterium]|nr:hypothetical protein [Solirubrobacteraceae bacterium]